MFTSNRRRVRREPAEMFKSTCCLEKLPMYVKKFVKKAPSLFLDQ